MNGVCRDTSQELLQVADDLEKYRDLLDQWLNGDENTTVLLGGVQVPTIRKLVHDIDDRESQGAQTVVDNGLQGMNIILGQAELVKQQVIALRNEIQAKIDTIHNLTASAEGIAAGATPQVIYTSTNNNLHFKLPKGDKGDKGDPGTVVKQYLDIVDCGGAYPAEGVITINGGKANSTYPNV